MVLLLYLRMEKRGYLSCISSSGKINITVIIMGGIILLASAIVGMGSALPFDTSFTPMAAQLVDSNPTQKRSTLQMNSLTFQEIPISTPTQIPPVALSNPVKPDVPQEHFLSPPIVENGQNCVQSGPANSSQQCCSGVPVLCDLSLPFPPDVPLPQTPDYQTPQYLTPVYQTPDYQTPNYQTPDYQTPQSGSIQSFTHKAAVNDNPHCEQLQTNVDVWCDGKPVIYLYPTKPTYVDVSLKVPGEVIVSDPLYPKGGWKNVLAYPDGTLFYQGRKYKELFYETAVTPIKPPQTGIVVSLSSLKQALLTIITKQGLIGGEQEEFLQYWLPRLYSLQSPYILISVFTPEQKEQIDHVAITPKPDTFIGFIMYYKPLKKPISISSLQFSEYIPKRIGFTAVEWGGIVDNN